MRKVAFMGLVSVIGFGCCLHALESDQQQITADQHAFESLFRQVDLLSNSIDRLSLNQFLTKEQRQQFVLDTVEKEKIAHHISDIIVKEILEGYISSQDDCLDQKLRAVHRALLALSAVEQKGDLQSIDRLRLSLVELRVLFAPSETQAPVVIAEAPEEQQPQLEAAGEACAEEELSATQIAREEFDNTMAQVIEQIEQQQEPPSALEEKTAEALSEENQPNIVPEETVVSAEPQETRPRLTEEDLNRIRAKARAIAKSRIRARNLQPHAELTEQQNQQEVP